MDSFASSDLLDWLTVFGYVAFATAIAWQVISRTK
jgi:hypothetical protein